MCMSEIKLYAFSLFEGFGWLDAPLDLPTRSDVLDAVVRETN